MFSNFKKNITIPKNNNNNNDNNIKEKNKNDYETIRNKVSETNESIAQRNNKDEKLINNIKNKFTIA